MPHRPATGSPEVDSSRAGSTASPKPAEVPLADRPSDDVAAAVTGAGAPRRRFRPEIQGLRAFAVVLVAAYHFWFGTVSGGVDVFLFVSAFLMSLSFTGKIERGTRIGWGTLSTYWVHVFKRILPLAVVTVLAILVGMRLFLAPERWMLLLKEALSVVFYYENWWSISNSVDYYNRQAGALSPFEHFWSLSVQGQIFLAWPLLFALGWLIVRFTKARPRPVLLAIFGTVFAASLAFSVWFTAANQTQAYYNTFARLWEFALGTIVAIVLPWIRLPRIVRALMSWVGLIAILICGMVLDVQGMFPGYVALWPVVAASLIIVAGDSETRWGADRILSWKPLVALGTNSYALYLIHWPLLVFFLAYEKVDHAGYMSGLGLLTVSVIGAVVVTRLVETPLRQWKWSEARRWRSMLVVFACLAIGALPVLGWHTHIVNVNQELEAKASKNNPGAASLKPGFVYAGEKNPTLLPTGAIRSQDWAWQQVRGTPCEEDGSIDTHGMKSDQCQTYVANDHPEKTVIAVGNSHVEMWLPALTTIAQQNHWRLIFVGEGGCGFTTVRDNSYDPACQEWLPKAEAFIDQYKPDDLFLQSTYAANDQKDTIRTGTEDQVRRWTGKGVNVLGMRDTPRFAVSHAVCEQQKGIKDCTYPSPFRGTTDPTADWSQEIPGYQPIDMNDLVCPDGTCPPEIGNVYTYLDANHLTSTYVMTTEPFLSDRLQAARENAEKARA